MTQLAKAKQISTESGTNLQDTIDTIQTDITSAGDKAEWGQITGSISSQTDLTNSLNTKVDKVAGKELSDNNYTTAEKNKLATAATTTDITNAVDNKVDKETGKGLIDPAPVDGKIYGRYNGGWSQVTGGGSGDVEEAPIDGKQYARKDASWSEVESSGGGGIPDAPYDNSTYGRRNAEWGKITSIDFIENEIDYGNIMILEQAIGDIVLGRPEGAAYLVGAFTSQYTFGRDSNGEWLPSNEDKMGILLGGVFFTWKEIPEFGYKVVAGVGYNYQATATAITGRIGLDADLQADSYVQIEMPFDPAANSPVGGAMYITRVDLSEMGSDIKVYSNSAMQVMIDSNGFVKESSPIVKLFQDSIEVNSSEEVKNTELEKLGTGVYCLNLVPLLSREGWYIETPKDRNGQPYFMLDYEEYPEIRELVIKTYEVAYDNGKAVNGEPVDILEGRFVSLRFSEEEKEEDVL